MNDLLLNIGKVHTTELGKVRIEKNLNLKGVDVVEYCKNIIMDKSSLLYRNGKNWYCKNNLIIITINAYSYTIITVHVIK